MPPQATIESAPDTVQELPAAANGWPWFWAGLLIGLGGLLLGRWCYDWLTAPVLPRATASSPLPLQSIRAEKAMTEDRQTRESQVQRREPTAAEVAEPIQGVKQAPANVPAHAVDTAHETLGYEPRDVSVRGVTIATVALLFSIIVGLFAVRLLTSRLEGTRPQPTPVTLVQPATTPAPPQLWIAPAADMVTYQREEHGTLDSFGWVDQANGVARIPITDAMQLLVAQPLSARDQEPPALFSAKPAYQLESTGGAQQP